MIMVKLQYGHDLVFSKAVRIISNRYVTHINILDFTKSVLIKLIEDISCQEKVFQNVVCKILANLFVSQYVE